MGDGSLTSRALDDADVAAVARVVRTVADEGRWIATAPGTPVEELEARYARLVADPAAHVVVVLDGDAAVGVGTIAPPAPRWPAVLGMSIAATHRGRGGGRLLLGDLLSRATADPGIHKVALEAWTDNAAAIGLYAAHGFVVEGILRDHWLDATTGAPRSSICMGWWPARGD
ncbi:GNAT family N-acetyltransferase [Patulibacter sp.]|uniref:GNAT family N-acetyltransferase n=1 Tax=Patulibacter sp. TaxID=1912859 RepID=UPI00272607DA|nr:GNAT family N-acetyltransferase [Patulibacter sp.]MDO9408114.1 GNAT family N-acetyltransferase [Patulibacter sp.]